MKFNSINEEAEHILQILGKEPDFVDEAINESMAHYVFYNKKQDHGVCSHCGKSFTLTRMLKFTEDEYKAIGERVPKIKKGSGEYVCPECYTYLQAYPAGYCRGKLNAGCRANYWQKKGKTLYLITKLVDIDFSEDKAIFIKHPRAIYIYGKNGPRRMIKKFSGWEEYKSFNYYFEGGFMGNSRYFFDIHCNPPDELLKGSYLNFAYDPDGYLYDLKETKACEMCTDFSPAWIDCEYLAWFQKYPAIEVLHKTGFDYLISDYLRNVQTQGAINWKTTKLRKIFRSLNMKEIREIREGEFSFSTIKTYQRLKKEGVKVSIKGVDLADRLSGYRGINGFRERVGEEHLEKAIKYLAYKNIEGSLYEDYLRECAELGRDMEDKKVRYPKDFNATHRETSAEIAERRKIKATIEQKKREELFVKRIKEAFPKSYEWHGNGFIIRPALNSGELIKEGNAMHHCVGGYDRYVASGRSFIIFIRQEQDPNKSFVTMEITQDFEKILQIRAKANGDPDKEVKKAAEQWLSEYRKQQKKLMRKETA